MEKPIQSHDAGRTVEQDHAERNPCTCPECSSTRVLHWWCSSCAKGPFEFVKHRFLGSRLTRNDKGVVIGIRYWCSRTCRVSEERTFLLSQLTVARTRGDLRLCQILTGQLAQLGQPQVPGPGSTEETASELITGQSDTVPE